MKKSVAIVAVLLGILHTVVHATFTTGKLYVPEEAIKFEWHEGKFAFAYSSRESELGLTFCQDAECKADIELKNGVVARIAISDKQMQTKQWLKVNKENGYIIPTNKFEDATEFMLTNTEEQDTKTFIFNLRTSTAEGIYIRW
ncbi:hypothetical protein GQ42DRAFT_153823 [Ramicandelaber brevisporus]|nr:hypothetical protein GQ42DRAFT_153823 [Ramicandelaber brevisporus]